MRAAEAARNTANLIEGTVKIVKEGSHIVSATNSEFHEVEAAVSKSGNWSGDRSGFQRAGPGIDQVSKAVAELDKVVQMNSANAEQSAAASEEMNAQAEQVKSFVGELEAMVGGSKSKGQCRKTGWLKSSGKQGKTKFKFQPVWPMKKDNGNGHLKATQKGPGQMIPFDEGEFRDF